MIVGGAARLPSPWVGFRGPTFVDWRDVLPVMMDLELPARIERPRAAEFDA